jgi:hypothetical protein
MEKQVSYSYATEKPKVFTEDGQVMFLKIRDRAKDLLAQSGAVTCEKLMATVTGDSWSRLACIDRLVELRELIEIPNPTSTAGQHRIFIKPYVH